MQGVRIALAGTVCTGKTTLARRLSELLGIELISEGFEPLRGKHKVSEKINIFHQVLETKRQLESKHGSFVSDRCPIDLLNLWLKIRLFNYAQQTDKFMRLCRQYTDYDFVIVLPWGALPLRQAEGQEGLRRTDNPWVQFYEQATIEGIASMWVAPEKLLRIDNSVTGIEERLRLIEQKIGIIKRISEF